MPRRKDVPLLRGVSEGAEELVQWGSNFTLYRYDPQPWAATDPQGNRPLPIFALLGTGAEPEPYAANLSPGTPLRPTGPGDPAFAAAQRKALDELVKALSPSQPLLLFIHGYSNDSAIVAENTRKYPPQLLQDTVQRGEEAGIGAWVSYDWPGERAAWGPAWGHAIRTFGELLCYLLIWLAAVSLILLVLGGFISRFDDSAAYHARPVLEWIVGGLAAFFSALLVTVGFLRLTTYHRDLYMALHRGVPDLCEFLRDLDDACYERHGAGTSGDGLAENERIRINVIAHSMGTMVTLNTVRILSDLFAPLPQHAPETCSHIGRSFTMGTLVLVAADIPVELLQVSQNNYFYSALRRFRQMYLFCNAHDGVLHALGYYANSFSEPQPGASRSRLGTVFHRHPPSDGPPPSDQVCARRWFRDEPVFGQAIGGPYGRKPAQPGTPPPPLNLIRASVSFLDCSELPTLSFWLTRALAWVPPVRDLLALVLYNWKAVDCHSGYFTEPLVWERMHLALRDRLAAGQAGNEVLRSVTKANQAAVAK